ncbi:TatD DNase family protein [Chitinivorax tropicus]|uniref:TatD DNase family protein n=1 Tax=Chitinivorax tropicus TaxID=714531 RepID=A0A840MMM1_9PROT|nr:TatD family hydrolase [Chitinivorax tropicus]MBB5019670.1 TatD DNase family protein [Chitinivorax tropicus]
MLVDTHCHLDAPEFDGDREQVVARAQAAGVTAVVVPAVARFNFESTLDMARRHGCVVAFGLHPIYIDQHQEHDLALLRDWVAAHRPSAIGEIGLDGFVPGLDMARQTHFFVEQLKIARDFDLPVLLHIRKSQDLVLKHLRRIGVRGGIAHAFNGSWQQAEMFMQLGFKLGFGGAMTFERALRIRDLAAHLPETAIVLETDAPDISPAWAYQQRNEPAHLPRIADELARLRGVSVADLARQTCRNACSVLPALEHQHWTYHP